MNLTPTNIPPKDTPDVAVGSQYLWEFLKFIKWWLGISKKKGKRYEFIHTITSDSTYYRIYEY